MSTYRLLASAKLFLPRSTILVRTALVLLAAPLAPSICRAQTAPPPGSSAEQDGPSVEIYGTLDAGVRHVDQAAKAGAVTQFASGLNTSRLGFRGSEPVDGALQAIFRLEDGFNPGTGEKSSSTALFDRTAMVGLRAPDWELRLGRQEGFGYELAASGATDPLAMALNLPNPASPAAAGSKAPVLGANPLQGLYSYTYGQLRYNNVLKISTETPSWSGGLFYAFGGVAGAGLANSARGAHIGAAAGPTRWDALYQQSLDARGAHSDLGVVAASWDVDAWKLQAGVHQLRIGAGFDSSGLGNGASASGILGSSTTVSPALAGARQEFRFTVADLGLTWKFRPVIPLTLAAYRTRSDGAGAGTSTALVALGKYYLSRRTALYLEVDHAVESGTLGSKTVTGGATDLAFMAGINVRF